MSIIAKSALLSLCLVLLHSCEKSPGSDLTDEQFLRCWDGQVVDHSLYRINFEAVIFPRAGVVSHNPSCPELRLKLHFRDASLPPDFDAFERAWQDRYQRIAIRGVALVQVDNRERSDLLSLRVRRLVRGEVLSGPEAARVLNE
jgi:hypothetical protein